MSDLAATNCNNNCGCGHEGGNGVIWLILILLFCCGGCNFCGNSGSFFSDRDNCGCNLIWIILLIFVFGNCGC